MKKIFAFLVILLLPLITFWDLLPEPDILNIDDALIADNNEQENTDANLDISNEISPDLDNKNDDSENNISEQYDDEVMNWDENIYEDDDFDPLAWLYFWFCDQWLDNPTRSYNWAWNQGEPFKMCAVIYNDSNRDITVQMDLTDAVVDENDWTNSCTLD